MSGHNRPLHYAGLWFPSRRERSRREEKEREEGSGGDDVTAWGTLNFLQLQVLESEVQKSEWLEAFQRNYTELIPV